MGNTYLIFVSSFWHTTLKTLGISVVMRVFLVCSWDGWWQVSPRYFKNGTGPQKDHDMIKKVEIYSLTPSISGDGRGLDVELITKASDLSNHTYLMRPLWKPLNGKVWRAFRFWQQPQVGEHIYVPGEWHTSAPWGQKFLCLESFQISPYIPLHLAVNLYPLL